MRILEYILIVLVVLMLYSCAQKKTSTYRENEKKVTAKDILGNSDYLAISYGGYRKNTRDVQPTLDELKEDMKILHAMGIKVLRTYNVQLPHASNMLQAISELKKEDPTFEMYVMLGAWIDCKNAWTGLPVDHHVESEQNEEEINRAVKLAQKYPDIVKIIAVGNEAMVHWATSYFVQPSVILKWVNYIQDLKQNGALPKELWVTSSDNFASWGGGGNEYHNEDLNKLIAAVDFISMHTYPMHDTHYNPRFWGVSETESDLSNLEKIDMAMKRARLYAESQYHGVQRYMKSLGISKPIHIGETGWASYSNGHYGSDGSKATDEYKEALFYKEMRAWTEEENMSCFYFEAFDEVWKDAQNPKGSENHFGLFTIDGKAKYVLWDLVDKGTFEGLTRGGNLITKTYKGNKEALLIEVSMPPIKKELVITNN